MQSSNYITIQGWMRTELNLKGNDLLVFAIIYGFSQSENQKFTGSLQYLADWCGATKAGIQKNLKNLIDAKLIDKHEVIKNGVKFCEYSCMVCNSVAQGMQLSCINKQINKQDTKTNSKELVQKFEFGGQKPKKESLYSKCVALINEFTEDEQVRLDLLEYLKLLLEMRKDGYTLYANTWKGLLRKLKELSTDSVEQHKIVSQSVERGYKSFFPVSDKFYRGTQNKPWERTVRSENYTEDELQQLADIEQQRELQGLQTRF